MSSSVTNRKSGAAERELQSAVNWKIFELQAVLVGGTTAKEAVSQKSMETAKLWLQPRHYEEVIKERANEGRCGFPLCNKSISVPKRGGGSESPVYHINLKTRAVEDGGERQYYCTAPRSTCFTLSTAYKASLEETMPISRECARSLNLRSIPTRVDDVLQTLQFHDASDSDEDPEGMKGQHEAMIAKAKRAKAAQNRFNPQNSPQKAPLAKEEKSPVKSPGPAAMNEAALADASKAPPPDYTNKKIMYGGAVQPRYWNVRNLDIVAAASNISQQNISSSHLQHQPIDATQSESMLASDPASSGNEKKEAHEKGMRALSLLESLRADPTKLNTIGFTSSSMNKQLSNTNTAESVTNDTKTGEPSSKDAKAVEVQNGSSASSTGGSKTSHTITAPGDTVVYAPSTITITEPPLHPSMVPAFAPMQDVGPLNQADIKPIKPSNRDKYIRDKYAKGGGNTMQIMGQGPAVRSPKPNEHTASKKKTDESHERMEELEQQEKHSLTAEEESDAAAELEEYEARHTSGGDFSSWRDKRLDTSQSQSDSKSAAELNNILLGAKPTGQTVPRVRMNPRGQRAQELAERERGSKAEADFEGMSPKAEKKVAVGPKVREKLVIPEGTTASEEELKFLEGLNEEIESAQIKASYDNMVVAGKVREVQWKEPDEKYSASRLKAVGKYSPPPPINKNAVKQSLFKKQREAAKNRLGSNPGEALKNSASNKTVQWEIKETANPQVMPETSISTKHGDEYELKDTKAPSFSRGPAHGVQEEEVWIEEPEEKEERERALEEEEKDWNRKEKQLQANRELRRAFFSSSGISAVVVPQGLSNGAVARDATRSHNVNNAGSEENSLAVEDIEDAGLVEEEYEDSDGGAEFSDDSGSDVPALPAKKPSTFLVLWTALDDILGHTGRVLKGHAPLSSSERLAAGRHVGGGDELVAVAIGSTEKQEAKSSVNIASEFTHSQMLATPNPAAIARGSASLQSILAMMSRGIATAEIAMRVNQILKPTQLAEYYYTKRRVLSLVDADRDCPPLSSSGWTFFGALFIDGVVRHRQLFKQTSEEEQDTGKWEDFVLSHFPLKDGGRSEDEPRTDAKHKDRSSAESKAFVDADELRILRSFFDDLY